MYYLNYQISDIQFSNIQFKPPYIRSNKKNSTYLVLSFFGFWLVIKFLF